MMLAIVEYVCLALGSWQLFKLAMFFVWPAPRQSTRRKMMIASWDAPSHPEIYGGLKIESSLASQWARQKSEESGVRISMTHMAIKAVGVALRCTPSLNGKIVFDKFVPHESVDIGCLVALDGGKQLAKVKICDADKKSVVEIAEELKTRAGRLRKGEDEEFKKSLQAMKLMPTFVLRYVLKFTAFLAGTLGFDFPAIGAERSPFGSCVLTSIGMLGLEEAYVPFTPFATVPLTVMIGQAKLRPAVDESTGEIVARESLNITATLDHRFVDGSQAGVLAKMVREPFAKPELYFERTDELPEQKKDE
jgi:pyruvate/2-oxoglutarate dehydrogenase complex dihydrolipoamide acyltransferase (E2) component